MNFKSDNYVPEWYKTPFDHLSYTLIRTQDQYDILFEDVNDTDSIELNGSTAYVKYYENSVVVILGDNKNFSKLDIYSILVHESVHIWQYLKIKMCEDKPSPEFEAYSIQKIYRDLVEMYEMSE